MKKIVSLVAILSVLSVNELLANSCSNEKFSVTIQKEISISQALDNIAENCGLSVVVKDALAQERLKKKLYYIKLKDSTLNRFLETILKDNDLSYSLKGDKLEISYLTTKTFKVHYISSNRIGKSSANINIANAGVNGKGASSKSGMTISSDDSFDFWKKLKGEIHRILVTSGDGSLHFEKKGNAWVDSKGHSWQFNPLEPIIDPEAGLITVTGTPSQIKKVKSYLRALSKQVKSQVMIDVKILSVTLNNDKHTGIDWSQLYGFQNFKINTLTMSQKNMLEWKYENGELKETKYAPGTRPSNAKLFEGRGVQTIDDLIKYLKTQGTVKTVSNPKIMTLNNQPALISVGKELFYKTLSATKSSDGKNSSTSENIQSVFAGVLLDITPEIDKHGMITLKINPSISETDGPIGSSGTRTMPPDLIRRQISTVIKVRNGKHAILGGLISTAESTVNSKVPLLGDIPLIGEAFKKERKITKTEELVIIITPRITNSRCGISLKSLGYRSITR